MQLFVRIVNDNSTVMLISDSALQAINVVNYAYSDFSYAKVLER